MADGMPRRAAKQYQAPSTWTGCYIGGNLGAGWSRTDTNRVSQDGVGPAPAAYWNETDAAFVGGAQVGCDYQFDRNWLIGVQGQFVWGDIDGSRALTAFPTFTGVTKVGNIDTVTGRIGYVVSPVHLLYAKGGVAWVQNDDKVLLPGGGLSESASHTQTGWTAGGGFEWMLARNWSAFAEWNHMEFESNNQHFTAAPGLLPPGEILSIKQSTDTVLVGINFRLN